MISIDGSLIFQIVNFLVMIIVLNALLYKPIRKIIRERNEKISGYETDISGLTDQVDSRLKEIDDKLAEARRDGYLKKDELKGAGFEVEKEIVAKATDEAEGEIQKIKDQIKGEISSARETLKAEIEIFSRELAQKVLGRSLS